MTETLLTETTPAAALQQPAAQSSCEECAGTGGWYRYEPAQEDGPGRLYLSCLQCRGAGRLALARG